MRYLRRKRGLAAVTAALLLVPAALAGDTVASWGTTGQPTPMANGLGRGFFGIDLEDLGASGELPEVSQLSEELMRLADDPNALASAGDPLSVPGTVLDIPGKALEAYQKAERNIATLLPGCHLTWPLLASIGRIESGHGNSGQLSAKGDTLDKILGPVLDGNDFAAIPDTDGGSFDGNTQWDRAVGPMQFIPGTWKTYAADGNGDGVSNPHNIFDAATAAGKYLCAGGVDLNNAQMRYQAVFRYNHSDSYVSTVLIWADAYAKGVNVIPAGLGAGTSPTFPDPDVQAAGPPPQEPIATTPPPPPPPPVTSTTTKPPDKPTTITPKPPTSTTTTTLPPCPPSTTPSTSSSTPAPSTSASELSGSGSPSQSAAAPSGPVPQGAVAPKEPCKPDEDESEDEN